MDKSIFLPKIHVLTNILFNQKIFVNLIFFLTRSFFLTQITFTKHFFDQKFLLTIDFCWSKFLLTKHYFWMKIFLTQNLFLTKIFWIRNYFWPNSFSEIFFTSISFWPIFSSDQKWPKAILTLNFFTKNPYFSTTKRI